MKDTVILRKYKKSDLQDYFNCVNDKKIKEFLPYLYCNNIKVANAILNKKIEAQQNENNNNIRYAIQETITNHVIGEISAYIKNSTAKITCFINSNYRGKSYAKKAILQLIESLKSEKLNLSTLEAQISIHNIASKKAFKKLDFKYKRTERETEIYEKEL